MSQPLRILLVDDHPVVRAGLRALLSPHGDFDVVGDAGDGAEGVRLAQRLAPDLVLMDLQPGPGIDGVEATRQLVALAGGCRVIVLTTYDSDPDLPRAVQAGAVGYLLKDASPELIFHVVRAAAADGATLSAAVASRLAQQLRAPWLTLSEREREVLELLAAGASNREISRVLLISEATVKTQVAHVYGKLGVDSRTAAVRVAVARRLIPMS